MKTILRILAIILVITAVAAGTYKLGQSQWATQQLGVFGGPGREEGRPRPDGNNEDGFRPSENGVPRPDFGDGFGDRDGRGRGFNIFAAAGFVRTLLPIALVTAVVVIISLLAQRYHRRHRHTQPDDTAVTS